MAVLIGVVDLRSLVCDPAELTSLFIFPRDGPSADDISAELCAIDDSLAANITNELIAQVDVTALLDVVSIVTSRLICHIVVTSRDTVHTVMT